MPLTLDQIVAETRQWPEDTVAELLDRITLAKHGGLAPEREAAWAEYYQANPGEAPGADGAPVEA